MGGNATRELRTLSCSGLEGSEAMSVWGSTKWRVPMASWLLNDQRVLWLRSENLVDVLCSRQRLATKKSRRNCSLQPPATIVQYDEYVDSTDGGGIRQDFCNRLCDEGTTATCSSFLLRFNAGRYAPAPSSASLCQEDLLLEKRQDE